MGHAEPAAGMAGMVKLVQQLGRTHLAPNAQLRVLNPHLIDGLGGTTSALPIQLGMLLRGGSKFRTL